MKAAYHTKLLTTSKILVKLKLPIRAKKNTKNYLKLKIKIEMHEKLLFRTKEETQISLLSTSS